MKEYLKGLKIGLGIITPIIIILIATSVFASQIPILNQQNNGFNIPELPKGGKYEITMQDGSNLSCVDLENVLGVPRGTVAQIETSPDGIITVAFNKDYKLNDNQVKSITDIYKKSLKEIKVK